MRKISKNIITLFKAIKIEFQLVLVVSTDVCQGTKKQHNNGDAGKKKFVDVLDPIGHGLVAALAVGELANLRTHIEGEGIDALATKGAIQSWATAGACVAPTIAARGCVGAHASASGAVDRRIRADPHVDLVGRQAEIAREHGKVLSPDRAIGAGGADRAGAASSL